MKKPRKAFPSGDTAETPLVQDSSHWSTLFRDTSHRYRQWRPATIHRLSRVQMQPVCFPILRTQACAATIVFKNSMAWSSGLRKHSSKLVLKSTKLVKYFPGWRFVLCPWKGSGHSQKCGGLLLFVVPAWVRWFAFLKEPLISDRRSWECKVNRWILQRPPYHRQKAP